MTSSLWRPMAILVLGKSAANDNLMDISNHLKGIDFSSNVLDVHDIVIYVKYLAFVTTSYLLSAEHRVPNEYTAQGSS